MKPRRGLSEEFIQALLNESNLGLNRFLKLVQNDLTLCLEIRGNYFNIYYRGGNLIKLAENNGKYSAFFDRKYILAPKETQIPEDVGNSKLENYKDITTWIKAIPYMKYEMDLWFGKHPKDEREAQQIMVRENNFGRSAKSTDYFICDIEYENIFREKFDMLAVYWPSSSSSRKNNTNLGLAFIEMKFRDSAMSGESGIFKHIWDLMDFHQKSGDNFRSVKQEMQKVFNQKLVLGLINNQKEIFSFNEEIADYIFIFANSDPDSRILRRELKRVNEIHSSLPFTLKFAVSNFMGYGLYKQNVYELDEFMERYKRQIYSK